MGESVNEKLATSFPSLEEALVLDGVEAFVLDEVEAFVLEEEAILELVVLAEVEKLLPLEGMHRANSEM